ncbi:MAG: hypothetical protein ABF306_05490 [Nocardioides marinisabuli]|uniref:hypothetical protein n=1 Tax=Nocardioides marinisabuli TaxID=419476 RepID=UPI00321B2FB1
MTGASGRRRTTRRRTGVAAGLVAGLVAGLGAGPVAGGSGPAAASRTSDRPTAIDLSTLERGPDTTIAYRRHRAVQHGPVRVRIPGRQPDLLGVVEGGYLVTGASGGRTTLRVLGADGSRRTLGTYGLASRDFIVGDEGRVVLMRLRGRGASTRLTLLSTVDGSVVARLRSQQTLQPLDVTTDAVVLSTEPPGQVLVWTPSSGELRRVVRGPAGLADLRRDVLVRTPRRDGEQCLEMSTVSDPRQVAWSRCAGDVPRALSPSGAHLLTGDEWARGHDFRLLGEAGEQLAHYRVRGGSGTGLVHLEDEHTVLLGVEADGVGAVVRCSGTHCELATDLTSRPPR